MGHLRKHEVETGLGLQSWSPLWVVHARVEVPDGSESLPISHRGWDQFSVLIHEYFLFLCFWGSCFFLVLSESGEEKSLAVPSLKASGRAVASDNTNG